MNYLEKRNKLPTNLKEFLSSDVPRQEAEKICFLYDLKETSIPALTYPIGLIFIKEIKLKDLPKVISEKISIDQQIIYGLSFELNERIFNKFPEYFTDALDLMEQWEKLKTPPVISEDEAWKKVLELEPWILEAEKEKRESAKEEGEKLKKIQASFINISFSDALKKYPDVGEQLITSSHIKLKNFPDPARPSIKNWLSDYTFNLGYDPHSSIVRGNYLFQSENARMLNSTDKQKLSFILKAFDENSPVSVNITTKQIVFPKTETPRQSFPSSRPQNQSREIFSRTPQESQNRFTLTQSASNQSTTPSNHLKFSSPQKMPFEKENSAIQKTPRSPQPMIISPHNFSRSYEDDSSQNKKPQPRNVVNLKDN